MNKEQKLQREEAETEARLLRARMAVLTNLVNERSDERDQAWAELKEIREATEGNKVKVEGGIVVSITPLDESL